MEKVNATLLLDLGNSETRFILDFEKNSKDYEMKIDLKNKFTQLKAGYKVPSQYKTSTFAFEHGGYHFAMGKLVEKEFKDLTMKPTVKEDKAGQLVTKLSLKLVFGKSLMLISEALNEKIEELDVTFDIKMILPAVEQLTQEEKFEKEKVEGVMKQSIRKIKKVDFLTPQNFVSEIKIGKIDILPEGLPAFFAACYKLEMDEEKGIIKEIISVENNKKFLGVTVLVLDIGEGTSDLIVIDKGEVILGSRGTIKRGGKHLSTQVAFEISKKYKMEVDDLEKVISTGTFFEGFKEHDVSDIIKEAKEDLATSLKDKIINYKDRVKLDLKKVHGILTVGGGALSTKKNGKVLSGPISEMLIDNFFEEAPFMERVNLNEVNSRRANIEGLRIIHNFRK